MYLQNKWSKSEEKLEFGGRWFSGCGAPAPSHPNLQRVGPWGPENLQPGVPLDRRHSGPKVPPDMSSSGQEARMAGGPLDRRPSLYRRPLWTGGPSEQEAHLDRRPFWTRDPSGDEALG